MTSADRTLEAAEEVARALAGEGAPVAIIGAMALAAHGYVRRTRDFDLGTATDPFGALRRVRQALAKRGFQATLREPDADDPLGGVLVVRPRGGSPIEVVNFLNPFSPSRGKVGIEAVQSARPLQEGGLPVVGLPHLVALKLYAGGRKSELDVLELLSCNPEADREAIREVCERFRLGEEWGRVARQLDGA